MNFPVHTTVPNKWNAFVSSGAEVLIGSFWIRIPSNEMSGKEDCESGMSSYEIANHPCEAVRKASAQWQNVYTQNILWSLEAGASYEQDRREGIVQMLKLANQYLESGKATELEK